MNKLLTVGILCSLFTFPLVSHAGQAPGIKLSDENGKVHQLSDYRGKTVVLEWFNEGCPFVRKHYDSGSMQKLQKQYTDQGIVWLTISSSAKGKQGYFTADAAKASREKEKASMTAILLDSDGKVGKLYGAKTTPHLFIIGSKGEMLYQGAIDDQPSTETEDLAKAKNYVDQALQEILAHKGVSVSKTPPYGCSVKY